MISELYELLYSKKMDSSSSRIYALTLSIFIFATLSYASLFYASFSRDEYLI